MKRTHTRCSCDFGFFLVIFTLALAMSALTVGSAFAAKGGKSGGGSGGTTNATLSVAPNPAPAYSYVQLSGCGYATGVWIDITVQQPVSLGFTSALTDGSGCFSHSWWVPGPYTYTVQSYEAASGANQR